MWIAMFMLCWISMLSPKHLERAGCTRTMKLVLPNLRKKDVDRHFITPDWSRTMPLFLAQQLHRWLKIYWTCWLFWIFLKSWMHPNMYWFRVHIIGIVASHVDFVCIIITYLCMCCTREACTWSPGSASAQSHLPISHHQAYCILNQSHGISRVPLSIPHSGPNGFAIRC